MLEDNNANYRLSYKTGLGFSENGDAIGWMVGWIEENEHPYFFSLNVEGPHDTDVTAVSMSILKGILKQMGFFEGKK
jgi:beta-lactamase class D